MGYQVGGQCFATLEEASNYKMSQVLPSILSDGSLKTPVYHNNQWFFDGHKVVLTFPSCDLLDWFQDGVLVGLLLVSLLLIAWLFRQIISMFFKTLADNDGGY